MLTKLANFVIVADELTMRRQGYTEDTIILAKKEKILFRYIISTQTFEQLTTPSTNDFLYAKLVEVDFGDIPVSDKEFTIFDPDVTAGSFIAVSMAYDAPTDKALDELEMDDLIIRAGSTTNGQFKIFINESLGTYLHGKFKINYIIYK
jgi:hypothetical protein